MYFKATVDGLRAQRARRDAIIGRLGIGCFAVCIMAGLLWLRATFKVPEASNQSSATVEPASLDFAAGGPREAGLRQAQRELEQHFDEEGAMVYQLVAFPGIWSDPIDVPKGVQAASVRVAPGAKCG